MMFGVEPQLPISVAPEVVRELEIEDVPPAPAREPEVEASGRAWGLEIYSDAEVQAAKAAAEAAQFRGLERDYTPKPPTGPVEIDARFSMLELD
jgi:hypothetical protein